MSKILTALAAAVDKDVPALDDSKAIEQIVTLCSKLPDPKWNKLSDAEQDYVNDCVDAINAKKPIPALPDAEPEPAARGRRRARDDDEGDDGKKGAPAFAKGDKVTITNKRGRTFDATVVDTDDKGEFVVDDGKDEIGYDLEDIKSGAVKVVKKEEPAARQRQREAEPEPPKDPALGDTVEIVTKRDKVVVGNVVELGEGTIVIKDATGEEHDFDVDRLKSIKVKVAAKAAEPEPAGRRARSSSKDDDKGKGDDKGERTRASNPGVSVGQRIREIILDNDGITEEKVGAMLDKEGLKYAPASLSMNYRDTHKFLDLLKARKMLKA